MLIHEAGHEARGHHISFYHSFKKRPLGIQSLPVESLPVVFLPTLAFKISSIREGPVLHN